jgi:hypothetical protein
VWLTSPAWEECGFNVRSESVIGELGPAWCCSGYLQAIEARESVALISPDADGDIHLCSIECRVSRTASATSVIRSTLSL